MVATASAFWHWRSNRSPAVARLRAPSHASNGPRIAPARDRSWATAATNSAREPATYPAIRSLCPESAFVALATTRSAPKPRGRCPIGVAVVLSTTSTPPCACVSRASSARSTTSSRGLDGVSATTTSACAAAATI
ncbi:Uncharacterised protein [Mycobacteroides abscessus subsp. abscessus]|nr:Uncharacterised protein [Mycobacteroides abscessus subsp. abscessus]